MQCFRYDCDTFFLHLATSECNIYMLILFFFRRMSRNRRFPFERTLEPVSLAGFAASDESLYAAVRRYAAVSRPTPEPLPYTPTATTVDTHSSQMADFVEGLKQQPDASVVDRNDFSAVREHDIQRWKHVNRQWQAFYRAEIGKQQVKFDELLRGARR